VEIGLPGYIFNWGSITRVEGPNEYIPTEEAESAERM
jgi:hypothetical protein